MKKIKVNLYPKLVYNKTKSTGYSLRTIKRYWKSAIEYASNGELNVM